MKKWMGLILLVCLSLCFAVSMNAAESASKPKVKRVVLIGADGLGANYIDWSLMPNLKKLRDKGAWNMKNRSVLPSSSAVNWATIMMGAGPELHGYTQWGSQKPEAKSRVLGPNGIFPTLFTLMREQRPTDKTLCTYEWSGVRYVIDEKAIDCAINCADTEIVDKTTDNFKKLNPVFSFICIHEPDGAGHKYGWGSPEYKKSIQGVDEKIGQVIAFLNASGVAEETMVVFISDHGGIKKGHGKTSMQEMETPFIMCGPGVIPGEITESMVHYDVASTIADLLGLKQPQVWVGRPVPMEKHFRQK